MQLGVKRIIGEYYISYCFIVFKIVTNKISAELPMHKEQTNDSKSELSSFSKKEKKICDSWMDRKKFLFHRSKCVRKISDPWTIRFYFIFVLEMCKLIEVTSWLESNTSVI